MKIPNLKLVTLLVASMFQILSAQDSIDTSQLPTSLTPETSYTVSVPYTASTDRDVIVEFWKANTWIKSSTKTVGTGSGTASFTLNLAAAPAAGTDYLWKSSIRPVGATWQENLDADSVSNVVVSSGESSGGTGAWIEEGGLVIIEPEHGDLHADWSIYSNDVAPSDPTMVNSLGSGWIEWKGKEKFATTLADADANGISTLRFEIKTEGVYTFRWHSKQHDAGQAGDQGNDTYVKFQTGTPQSMTAKKNGSTDTQPIVMDKFTKVWVQKKDAWSWTTTFEPLHGWFVQTPKVHYTAGIHEIKLAGRSKGHAIDRIVLHHSSVGYNASNFEAAEESARDGNTAGPIIYDATTDFPTINAGDVNFYVDNGNDALGINPNAAAFDDTKFARASLTFDNTSNDYDVTITTMTEFDGECTYRLLVNGSVVGSYQNPAVGDAGDLQPHTHTWHAIAIANGDTLSVEANSHSNDTHIENNGANGFAWARGRWQQIELSDATYPAPDSAAENTPSAGQYGEKDGSENFKKWHKVTVAFEGPNTNEAAGTNPFTDYRLNVTFTHPGTGKSYLVPGYYAADGNAGESSASSGNIWRVHFAPDETGTWNYSASFRTGSNVAVNSGVNAGSATSFDGTTGSLNVVASDKTGVDHRGKGRLHYDGSRYLKYGETGEAFIKTGADAPENFLNYLDFDNTYTHGQDRRKSWAPHIQDWSSGDPAWQNGKGKGIIGAVNYLASEGQNVFSFLTYNAGGDSKDVWPYISHTDPLRFDCSKLDQWEIVFAHGDKLGMYLHFKTQERENDDLDGPGSAFALDNGNVGTERKLYYRELIARFGHHLALNWNLGEENSQSTAQQQAMAQYFRDTDPYGHNVVLHTYPNEWEQVYRPLLGSNSELTGVSIQTSYSTVHSRTLQWLTESAAAGKQWVAANDEQGSASHANPPDDGWPGYAGGTTPSQKDMRWKTVWGNLMAGGAGVELYAGYQNPQSDLTLDDFRSRDRMWDYCRHARNFFNENLPFAEMNNANALIGNASNDNSKFCFAKTNEVYAIYLPNGGTTNLDLSAANGNFTVRWFNPRNGGALQTGTVATVSGGASVSIGNAPSETSSDWAILVSKSGANTDVSIAAPSNATQITVGTPITFRASKSNNTSFDRIEFYVDSNLVGTRTTAPYEITLNNLTVGAHTLSITEFDTSTGSTNDSISVTIVESQGVDSIDLSQLPTTMTPATSYTVSLPYTATIDRDVTVGFWKGGTWLQGATKTVSAGSGTVSFTLNLATAPVDGTDYLWKASIRPVGTTWQENIQANSVTDVVVGSDDPGNPGDPGEGGTGAWIENGGLVVIEAENIETTGNWVARPTTHGAANAMAGSLGDGWLEWTGGQYSGNTKTESQVNAILTATFEITTEGTYYFRTRMKQYNNVASGDAGNDSFVSLTSGTPVATYYDFTNFTKMWVQSQTAWSWHTTFEPVHGEHHANAKIRRHFTAGTHTIRLAARSPGHAIDRIVLHHSSVSFNEANFNSAPESERNGDSGTGGEQLIYDATADFPTINGGTVNYYVDNSYDALAINPNNAGFDDTKFARASLTFDGTSDDYNVTITTLTEFDGECTYRLLINGAVVGNYQNPAVGDAGDLQPNTYTWNGITINDGDTISVESNSHSNDTHVEDNGANGFAWARGRWQQIELTDATTPAPPSAAEDTSSAGEYGETDGSGNFKKWHKVTVAFEGPNTTEGAATNPFTDYRLNVTFTHPVSGKTYLVPGYYAADGNSGESGASGGNIWRVHFAPDEVGTWNYSASFRTGSNVAVNSGINAGTATSFDGATGNFTVVASDKTGRDHRGKGRLQYDGSRYLKFSETGEAFLKTGADAPENFLNYLEFDNTYTHGQDRRKSWAPHIQDWSSGDPTWKSGKGKGIIGAVNYLASEGQNVFSFLTYNAGGDSKDVWPYIEHTDPLRFDCSKLDQWEIVFSHGDKMGMYLHFKTQETENDDNNQWALDNGDLGTERKLYYRELMARFGHHLALNWNLGEENTQTTAQQQDMAQYFHDNDPYGHHIVLHTYPDQQEQRYRPMLGSNSELTGVSIQTNFGNVHKHTIQWLSESAAAGKQWVAANDEQGSANLANPPDDGYPGYAGGTSPSQKDMRWKTVWGNFMAGGAGIELYAGYQNVQSDLTLDDFRSRDRMWDYCRHALTFFTENLPFDEMNNANSLIGNTNYSNSKYCFAKTDEIYAIYLPNGGTTNLDLSAANGNFIVRWFNPRDGGALQIGTIDTVSGGSSVSIGNAPSQTSQDWAVLISKSGPDPDVNIISPTNGTEVIIDTPVTLRAAISDNPNFDRVDFYLNGELVATKTSAPYEVTFNDLPLGVHNLSVIEVDSQGNRTMDSIGVAVIESLGEVTHNFSAVEDVFIQGTTVLNDNYLKIQNSGPAREGYLKFTVSGIPAGDTIKSATLNLQENGDTGNGTLRVYSAADPTWTEGTITSANAPTTVTEIGTHSGSISAAQSIQIDISSLITGNGTFTVIIKMDSGGNDIWFGSSESARPPVLTVVSGEEATAGSTVLMNQSMVTDAMMLTWWPSDATLMSTQDLSSDDWQPVPTPANPYHVELNESHRFYRVSEPVLP